MDDNVFKANINGILMEYEVISSVKNIDNNKDYLIYKKRTDDKIYASIYKVENNELVLYPIEDKREWDFIDRFLEVNHV